MIVRHIDDLRNTEQFVSTDKFTSTRLIIKADGMGYSVHHTLVQEGTEIPCHYKDHLETNYCIAGEGEVLDVETGAVHQIRIGTMYALNKHDEHVLRATKGTLHLICVFNPALAGAERHNPDGGYDAG
ncbi:L-ectoine synthase [Neorhizobium galegae]|uniref:ectoine synthase n=1 Tax=Neorhizobium galegae TaxID=399 RepID=UPI001AE3DAE8|nr:ectoine synthase [Neorhizobium galegae]MBP2562491.1 L-ectoine synthase [Neorhizobium galegae]